MSSSKGRKRSRAVTDENRADCPFTVTIQPAPTREERDAHKAKKRKGEGLSEDEKKLLYQSSPFSPTGKFRTHSSMDIYYTVDPRKRWSEMNRYNSFVLNGTKYYTENFIYVANETTIEKQKSGEVPKGASPKSNDYWVAKILEVRASDEHHVYARIYWMYSPDELPQGTVDGKKTVGGRQAYHGANELIASNHMDIINVVSVTMPATVNHWIEEDDDEVQDALYWRQAYDCRTGQLSAVQRTCGCDTPANPDEELIGCTNPECAKWMHRECLKDDVLTKVYNRLGTSVRMEVADAKLTGAINGNGGVKTGPLSTDEKNSEEPGASIAVLGGENTNRDAAKPLEDQHNEATSTPTPTTTATNEDTSRRIASTKKGRGRRSLAQKPYHGLFDATLKTNEGPVAWEITDLRENVTGGAKTWLERAQCLLCNTPIE